MTTNWVKQHKTAITVTALVVLFISVIGVVGAYPRKTTHGYNEGVYWDVTVEKLYRSGNYTYSTHQYYIENNSDVTVFLIDYEFKHRVIQTFPGESGKADIERIVKKEPKRVVTVKIPPGTSSLKDFTHEVDIRGLKKGWYYIHAYTRINLDDIQEDPVPEAHLDTKSDLFLIE